MLGVPDDEWGHRVVAFVVGEPPRSTRPATGWPRRTRGRGRRASVVALDALPMLEQRQGRPDGLRELGVTAASSRSRCARASAGSPCARACCCGVRRAGASGAPSWSTTPEVAGRGCAAPRRPPTGDWPEPVRDAVPGQRHRARVPTPSARTRSCWPAAARTAKVKVAEPGQTLGDDQARLEAVRDALGPDGPDPGRRQRRLGRRRGGGRDPPRSTAPPAAWSTSSSPCATVEDLAARPPRGSTCRSRPTSRSAGPRTPTGCATWRPPTSRCSRCSRSAACGPACGSPRTSGCRSWSRRALETSVGIAAGRRAGRGAARAALRLRARDRAAARRRRGPPSRCCRSTGCCRWAGRGSTRTRSTGWPRPRPGRRVGGAAAPPCAPCGRIGRRDRLRHRPRPRTSSARWSRPASPRSWSRRARATRRCLRGVRRGDGRGCCGCTPASTSARPGSWRSGLAKTRRAAPP